MLTTTMIKEMTIKMRAAAVMTMMAMIRVMIRETMAKMASSLLLRRRARRPHHPRARRMPSLQPRNPKRPRRPRSPRRPRKKILRTRTHLIQKRRSQTRRRTRRKRRSLTPSR